MIILTARCPHCKGSIYSEVYQKEKEYFCLLCAREVNPEMMAIIRHLPTAKDMQETRKTARPFCPAPQRQQRQRLPRLLSAVT